MTDPASRPSLTPGLAGPEPTDPEPAGEVTRLLHAWQEGRGEAFDELVPLVYEQLRRIARGKLRAEGEGHTLQTTALVHEVFLRLVGSDIEWRGSSHFLRVAARAMRRILVDHARARMRGKRGGGVEAVHLDSVQELVPAAGRTESVIELDQALTRLWALDERKGQLVELHYFGGLSYEEAAEALSISPATVHRDLRMARAWLYKELADEPAE
jgi:RNA polymerase sigma factor (TIGR02999 family)